MEPSDTFKDIKPAVSKDYLLIWVSERAINFATRNNGIRVRQE